jgi:hypothetical protein
MANESRVKVDKATIQKIQDKLKALTSPLNQDEAREIGQICVEQMKNLIGKGISPISGGGYATRFPRYKNPKNYPGKVRKRFPGKTYTPVNLHLSGDFLDSLNFKVLKTKGGFRVSVGYDSAKSRLKEQGHREEGANGQPERPTIPDVTRGESFARLIQDRYLRVAKEAIKRLTKA